MKPLVSRQVCRYFTFSSHWKPNFSMRQRSVLSLFQLFGGGGGSKACDINAVIEFVMAEVRQSLNLQWVEWLP